MSHRGKTKPCELSKVGEKREADVFAVDDNIQWRDTDTGGQSIWLVAFGQQHFGQQRLVSSVLIPAQRAKRNAASSHVAVQLLSHS